MIRNNNKCRNLGNNLPINFIAVFDNMKERTLKLDLIYIPRPLNENSNVRLFRISSVFLYLSKISICP